MGRNKTNFTRVGPVETGPPGPRIRKCCRLKTYPTPKDPGGKKWWGGPFGWSHPPPKSWFKRQQGQGLGPKPRKAKGPRPYPWRAQSNEGEIWGISIKRNPGLSSLWLPAGKPKVFFHLTFRGRPTQKKEPSPRGIRWEPKTHNIFYGKFAMSFFGAPEGLVKNCSAFLGGIKRNFTRGSAKQGKKAPHQSLWKRKSWGKMPTRGEKRHTHSIPKPKIQRANNQNGRLSPKSPERPGPKSSSHHSNSAPGKTPPKGSVPQNWGK